MHAFVGQLLLGPVAGCAVAGRGRQAGLWLFLITVVLLFGLLMRTRND